MKNNFKTGFTLIEFVVAITIFFLVSLMAFAPYSYHLNKSKVKHTAKEVSQLIYEAKNMAVNGVVSTDENISVAVVFDSGDKNSVKIVGFPHDFDIIHGDRSTGQEKYSLLLQPGVQFDSIEGQNSGMLFFQSITGSGTTIINDAEHIDDIIEINFSYKGATNSGLQSEVKYISNTQIVDY